MKKLFTFILFIGIYFNTFSQASWLPLNSGTQKDLFDISFPSAQTGYVAGSGGTILKTTDSGINWASLFSDTLQDFISLHFPGNNTGYALTQKRLYRTTNGGINWQLVLTDTTSYMAVVYFLNDSVGYIGTESSILKTSDRGANWMLVKNTSNRINTISFPSSNAGYFAGGTSYTDMLYKTTDQGQTFSSVTLSLQVIKERICFINDQVDYLTGWYGGVLMKTTNGGQTWTQTSLTHDTQGWDVYFHDQAHGYYIDNSGGLSRIFKSVDGGVNWIVDASSSPYAYGKFAFTPVGKGFAIGKGGGIYSIQTTLMSLSEAGRRDIVKIFPNPGKGQIKLSSDREQQVFLLNIMGQQLQGLYLNASNNFQGEINNLPEGTYFISGKRDNQSFVQKIIVFK